MRSITMPDIFRSLQPAGIPALGKEDGVSVDPDAGEIRRYEI